MLLANLPPSQTHVRLALAVIAVLVIAFAVTLPFRDILLPPVAPSVAILQTAITINDLITAVLLYAQFSIVRQRGLLILAGGYLYSALIVIPYPLTFPGVYAPTGLLGAGLQTTSWLYWCWHLGLPFAVIAYAMLKDVDRKIGAAQGPASAVIGLSAGIVIALVCGLALLAIVGEPFLPKIQSDPLKVNVSLTLLIFSGCLLLPVVVALALLWRRRRSVLDLWLKVMCVAWLVEIIIGTLLVTARFTLGWYGSRIYSLIAAILLLIVLLSETTTLYANLARSTMRRRAAGEARQIAMDAMAASIAHEIRQPLAAIAINSETALLLLSEAAPDDVDEARAVLHCVVDDSHRASAVIGGIRSMYRKDSHGRAWLDVNGLVREALATAEIELRTHRVSVSMELDNQLPQVFADRGQLQQVFQNLIMNAIEAMHVTPESSRVLRTRSNIVRDSNDIMVSITDFGTGIGEKDKDRIFEPFFTTKSAGTGIGLTICQSIIESHGGGLRAFANRPYGTIVEVVLPIGAVR
jgi:signal transduction histidine kinase